MNAQTRASGGIRRRRIIQWSLAPVVIATIALGWKHPIFGFSVPLVMLMGLAGGVLNGRYVCGNLCPRGALFDRAIAPLSRRERIPAILRRPALRWSLFAVLMTFLFYRGFQNPADWRHWGRVFWLMCVVTTSIGVVFGLLVHPRLWCSFCPMGTLQSALGGRRNPLRISADLCIECKRCEKVCPFGLSIVAHKGAGRLGDPDCLRCPECVAACPKAALSWPRRSA